MCVLSSPPNRYLFSSRCDSIYTEKKGEKKSRRADCLAGRENVYCVIYLLSLNILTILSNASDISDNLG